MGQVRRPPWQVPPVSASEAEETTFLMVLDGMSMTPFARLLSCQPGWQWAAARLQALGKTREATSTVI
jgi:hypothetical protein